MAVRQVPLSTAVHFHQCCHTRPGKGESGIEVQQTNACLQIDRRLHMEIDIHADRWVCGQTK